MTLDAYVKMAACECGYFQGDETFDVHAASSLQEFSEKKHEVLQWYIMTLKTMTTTTTKRTSTSAD